MDGRPVNLYYRAVGAISWTSMGSASTDSNGQIISSNFNIEYTVGGVTGDYEFKADYIPSGGDVGVYTASTLKHSFSHPCPPRSGGYNSNPFHNP